MIIRLAIALAPALAGCGDDYSPIEDDGGDVPPPLDVALDECGREIGGPRPGECDPLTQEPCAANEKCTWIVESVTPSCGHLGCAFAGELAVGESCTPTHDSVADACARGLYCDDGCRPLCDHTGAVPGCAAGETCEAIDDVFVSDAMTIVGVCR